MKIASLCPACGECLDGAATACGDDGMPSPGDLTVTICCAQVLKFGDHLELCALPEDERLALPKEILEEVARVRSAVTQANWSKRGGSYP